MDRLAKLSHWLKQQSVDVAWIVSTENVYYFTGCYVVPRERLFGLFVFANQDPIFLCPKMEEMTVKSIGWRYDLISYDDMEDPWHLIQTKLQHRFSSDVRRIAIEKEQLTYAKVEQLHMTIPNVKLVRVDDVLQQFRLYKQKQEIKLLKQAAEFADEAMQIGIESVYEGCMESEVVSKIEFAMKKSGVPEMAFQTIVLFGDKTALPHGVPSHRKLQSGDFILIDLGVKAAGYCSDLTRTFAFKAISKRQADMYDTVWKAQQAALAKCMPDTRIGQLDVASCRVINQSGYGKYVLHRTGHGLGLDIHESPSIDKNNQEILHPNMVVTIEPGIYVPGVGGVRIEDDVLITNTGYDILTHFPRDLQLV